MDIDLRSNFHSFRKLRLTVKKLPSEEQVETVMDSSSQDTKKQLKKEQNRGKLK